nr:MAG TPA: protein of unknown function (DUF4834) [Caudoviricetes sp.]
MERGDQMIIIKILTFILIIVIALVLWMILKAKK